METALGPGFVRHREEDNLHSGSGFLVRGEVQSVVGI